MKKIDNVFIVGIKGVAMANLAIIYQKLGKNVSGADTEEEFITDKLLRQYHTNYQIGFGPEKLPQNTDLVIYSAAHGGTKNPLVIEAEKRKIEVISQAEAIGKLMRLSKIKIAVAGCHGKTTISSLLTYLLIKLGAKPNYMVGTPYFTHNPGGDFLGGDYFVAEADEYGVNPPFDKTPKFHFLDPDYIICPNIDFDHPDVYVDIEETKKAYMKFFDNKKLIACCDDPNLFQCLKTLKRENYITYGYRSDSDYRITEAKTDEPGSSFVLVDSRPVPPARMVFRTSLFGEKNVSNTAGVISLLLHLGFTAGNIQKNITGFTGARRRFEPVFRDGGFYFFDDYAHHPKEIETMVNAARMRFPHKRLVIIFQPHTYSRTKVLLIDFAKSLSLADRVYLLPIFPSAREDKSRFTVKSSDIVKAGDNGKLIAVNNSRELMDKLRADFTPDEVLFTMGAGDVYKLKNDIIKAWMERK